WTWEEMAVKEDAGLVVSWPRMRAVTAWWMDRSESEQQDDARRAHEAIDEAFNAAEAYLAAKDADANHPTDLRWEAMRGVLGKGSESDGQLPVFIQANDIEQIVSAVTWGAKRGLKVV